MSGIKKSSICYVENDSTGWKACCKNSYSLNSLWLTGKDSTDHISNKISNKYIDGAFTQIINHTCNASSVNASVYGDKSNWYQFNTNSSLFYGTGNWIDSPYEDSTDNQTFLHDYYNKPAIIVSPGDRLRKIIQARMAPRFHRRRRSLSTAMDIRERRARQTLRRVIGDQAFRKFMRDGFITVVPKSGLTYKIRPGHGMTQVYDRGIMVDLLCVVLQGDFPPTDSLLMRYLLILNDEGEFCKYAVKHAVSSPIPVPAVFPMEESKPLTEEWAKLVA